MCGSSCRWHAQWSRSKGHVRLPLRKHVVGGRDPAYPLLELGFRDCPNQPDTIPDHPDRSVKVWVGNARSNLLVSGLGHLRGVSSQPFDEPTFLTPKLVPKELLPVRGLTRLRDLRRKCQLHPFDLLSGSAQL